MSNLNFKIQTKKVKDNPLLKRKQFVSIYYLIKKIN